MPRVVDLPAVLMSSEGRVEFDTIEEGREAEILLRAMRTAELEVFRRRLGYDFAPLLARFDEGLSIDTGELTPASDLLDAIGDLPAWRSCSSVSASKRKAPASRRALWSSRSRASTSRDA